MPEAWESAPIVAPAAPREPWEDAPIVQASNGAQQGSNLAKAVGRYAVPLAKAGLMLMSGNYAAAYDEYQKAKNPKAPEPVRMARGLLDAAQAGYQESATGLLDRGRRPGVILDPQHSTWAERMTALATKTVADLPEMVAGGAAAGLLGLPSGPGALAAAGAGAFAAPAALREALMTAYETENMKTPQEFLERVGVGVATVAKDAAIGYVSGGTGGLVTEGVLAAGGTKLAASVLGGTSEYAVMTVAPAVLEGHLPSAEDFANAGILMLGMKGAHVAYDQVAPMAAKLRRVYRETGKTPAEVLSDAVADPTIREDLLRPAGNEPMVDASGITTEAGKAKLIRAVDEAVSTPEAMQAFYDAIPETKGGRVLAPDLVWEHLLRDLGVDGHERAYDLLGADRHAELSFAISNTINQKLAALPAGTTVDIITGAVGSGKSTAVQASLERPGAVAFESLEGSSFALAAKLQEMKAQGLRPTVTVVLASPEQTTRGVVARGRDIGRYVDPGAQDHSFQTYGAVADLFDPANAQTFGPSTKDVTLAVFDRTSGSTVRLEGPEALAALRNAEHTYNAGGPNVYELGTQAYRDAHSNEQHPAHRAAMARHGGLPDEVQGERGPGGGSPVELGQEVPAQEVGIPEAYRPLADRLAVEEAVTGLPETVAAELFGPPVRVPGEPSPTHVNYRTLNTPDQINGALAKLSELNLKRIQEQRRGTVSWDQTQIEAEQVVSEYLGDPSMVRRAPGSPAGAAELLARKQMLEGAAANVKEMARAHAEAQTAESAVALLESINRMQLVQETFLGARAEAGRTLNILRETRSTARQIEQINALLEKVGSSPEELAGLIDHIDSVEGVAKFARDIHKASTAEKVLEVWKASILSGPITHVKNMMSNLVFEATRPLTDTVAAAVSPFMKGSERVHWTEPLAGVIGNLHGIFDMATWANVKDAFLNDAPSGKAQTRGAIGGKTGYAVRSVFRALEAEDVLFRTMAERSEAFRLAARQAAKDGYSPLTHEFASRVATLANNPPEAWIEPIQDFGAKMVFRQELGKFGKDLNKFVAAHPLLEVILPFRTTPMNVFKQMVRHSPAAPFMAEVRADFEAGGPRAARAAAEIAVGTGLMVGAMALAFGGKVSGAGDPDPNKKRVKTASGWQPYSMQINGKWYSYQQMQPVGTLFGLSADMAEMWQYMDAGEKDKALNVLGAAFANSVTNQTFLQGLSQTMAAFAHPERGVPRMAQSTTASVVPGAIGQTAQMLDPYQREITSIKEAVLNRIPGLRETLPPARDPYGEPVANPDRALGASPITMREPSKDPVRTEAARLGVGAAKAPKSIHIPDGGVSGSPGKVELTPGQRDVFADVAGHMAYQILSPLVNSPTWKMLNDEQQRKAYEVVFEKSRSYGQAAALTDEQRQREIQRVIEEVNKRMQPRTR